MARLVTLLTVGLIAINAWGAPLTLKELRTKLKMRGASWAAGENSVTRLSPAERKMMLGANIDDGVEAYFINRDARRNRALPSVLDWRNKDGVNFASPILNQGRCGSCVAFAAIGTLETQTNITRNTPDSPWALSPQYLFSCGGGSCHVGWQPSEAVSFLQSTGVPDEACYPYASGALGEDLSCSSACADASSRVLRITGSTRPTTFISDVEAVKTALQKGPLETVMAVYEDFFFYQSGVYRHVTGDIAGGHALSIVGYNDDERSWIVRNSWGEDWGDRGYFRIAWDDDSGLGHQTWGMEVPAQSSYVTLGSLRDKTVLSGKVQLNPQSTYPGTHVFEIVLAHQSGRVHKIRFAPNTPFSFDTTSYADGVYTMAIAAGHATGTATSTPRIVYILNGKLTGSVAFTNVSQGQTIATEKFVMNLTTQSSPVPFATVRFHAKNVATGQEWTKSTTNVAPKLAMSWRMKIPAGDYDLWLEGIDGSQAVTSSPVRVKVAGQRGFTR